MRLLLCGLALASFLVSGCGSDDQGRPAPTASQANSSVASSEIKDPARRDGDGDLDTLGAGPYDSDNDVVLKFGSPASAADRLRIEAALRHYYKVASDGEGARACALLDPVVAEGVLEAHHSGMGPPALQGSTCGRILSKLFALHHRELVEDLATFRIGTVQVRGNRAVIFVPFSQTRDMELIARRTHGVWRMDVPLDNGAV